jgi:hypothetical protein
MFLEQQKQKYLPRGKKKKSERENETIQLLEKFQSKLAESAAAVSDEQAPEKSKKSKDGKDSSKQKAAKGKEKEKRAGSGDEGKNGEDDDDDDSGW